MIRTLRAVLAAALLSIAAPAGAQTLTPPDSAAGCRWMPECSTPGATLRMLEVSRTGDGREAKVTISPRVAGLPAGEPLTFWMRRVGEGASWIATGYQIDAAGAVVCADRVRHEALVARAGTGWCPVALDSMRLTVGGAMEGEPFAFAISTLDGRQSAYAEVVPRPAVVTAAGCGTLEAQLASRDAQVVRIVGRGFAPATVLRTESTRGKESVAGEVTTDSTGRFVGIVHGGGRGGDASYTVRGPSCSATLPYRWGRAAR